MKVEDTAIFIQARTGSTRLPNKILKPFYKGKSILDIVLEVLVSYTDKYKIVLCTSMERGDDILERYAAKYNIHIFRGSENNVLSRFVEAANQFKVKNIVRVCSDNPFLDKKATGSLIKKFEDYEDIDYASFKNNNGIPAIKTHIGLFAEVVRVEALKQVLGQTSEKLYLEHVTNFIYQNPHKFKVSLFSMPAEILNNEFLRFTVDDQNDFDNLSVLFEKHVKMGCDTLKTVEYVLKKPQYLNAMKINIKKYSK